MFVLFGFSSDVSPLSVDIPLSMRTDIVSRNIMRYCFGRALA